MAIAFKKGDQVRQVVPVIEGKVVDVAIVDGDVQFCVEYTGTDGEPHQRFFTEAEIEKAAEA
jgi:glycine betaine/choline ABC-type transport system substrate-binding protein